MVYMTLQSKYFNALFIALSNGKFFESILNALDIKYFSAVSRTKHKVVVNQRYSCLCMFIFILHGYIVTY